MSFVVSNDSSTGIGRIWALVTISVALNRMKLFYGDKSQFVIKSVWLEQLLTG